MADEAVLLKKLLTNPELKKAIKLFAKIKASKDTIAKERDKLRDYMGDLEAIVESTTEGLDDIERGIDTLSQYL